MCVYIYNYLKVVLFTSLMYILSQRDAASIGLIKAWHFSAFIDTARFCWVETVAGDPSSMQTRICWPIKMVNTH